MNVIIDDRQDKIKYDENMENLIVQAVKESLKEENVSEEVEVSVTFVDNDAIKELNRDYRNKDSETDVLSFPQYDSMDEINIGMCLGDIVISLEKAEEQRQLYNHSFDREVLFLTVHSMFHLMGYDHDTEENTKEMRMKEEKVLSHMGILRK
ncbi:rRNA maturation RNase YbeY [Anaeromicrobium sediminis]|uniref:Endoribonuclease YbeY n=1 Tax=Anaeromicrobium sediminis TaxID=1478221 RepID=A0A267MJ85_9FIRM|nr:rRNA maturation RNase YbeY [Anaeromicrobium sediminis]PAB58925.1 rRNA maturation RNase YbeY [Anaeromicrobium sediminis]